MPDEQNPDNKCQDVWSPVKSGDALTAELWCKMQQGIKKSIDDVQEDVKTKLETVESASEKNRGEIEELRAKLDIKRVPEAEKADKAEGLVPEAKQEIVEEVFSKVSGRLKPRLYFRRLEKNRAYRLDAGSVGHQPLVEIFEVPKLPWKDKAHGLTTPLHGLLYDPDKDVPQHYEYPVAESKRYEQVGITLGDLSHVYGFSWPEDKPEEKAEPGKEGEPEKNDALTRFLGEFSLPPTDERGKGDEHIAHLSVTVEDMTKPENADKLREGWKRLRLGTSAIRYPNVTPQRHTFDKIWFPGLILAGVVFVLGLIIKVFWITGLIAVTLAFLAGLVLSSGWPKVMWRDEPPIEVEFPNSSTVIVRGTRNLCHADGRPVRSDSAEALWVMILIRG